jgi:hypothetical protein
MAIAFRSASLTKPGNGSGVAGTKPSGVASGDVLIAFLLIEGSHTITPPSGWTQIDTQASTSGQSFILRSYYLVAGGSEPSTYTWTVSGNTFAEVQILAFTGVDNASPIDVHGIRDSHTDKRLPSITTTVANDMLAACQAFWNGANWSDSSPYTAATPTGGTFDGMGSQYRLVTTATSYGNEAWSFGDANNGACSAIVALKPGATSSSVSAAATLALKAADLTKSAAASIALKSIDNAKSAAASIALSATLSKSAAASIALLASLSKSAAATVALKSVDNQQSAAASLALLSADNTVDADASIALLSADNTVSAGATIALADAGVTSVSAAASIALKSADNTKSAGATVALKSVDLAQSAAASIALSATLSKSAAATLALKATDLAQSAQASIALKSLDNSVSAGASLALKQSGIAVIAAAAIALKAVKSVSAGATICLSGEGHVILPRPTVSAASIVASPSAQNASVTAVTAGAASQG